MTATARIDCHVREAVAIKRPHGHLSVLFRLGRCGYSLIFVAAARTDLEDDEGTSSLRPPSGRRCARRALLLAVHANGRRLEDSGAAAPDWRPLVGMSC